MARIKYLELDEVEPIAEDFYKKTQKSSGRVIHLFKALAHSPKILRDWGRLGTTLLMKGETSRKLLEIAIIRVGEINQAAYELTAHRRIGLECGLTQDQVTDIANWQESDKFDDLERAILQYTDEVSQNIRVSDESFNSLRKHFSERQMVEITVTIGYYHMVCRFLEPMQIDLENA
jgi:4-carboxymuconolactone decarboxylase